MSRIEIVLAFIGVGIGVILWQDLLRPLGPLGWLAAAVVLAGLAGLDHACTLRLRER